MPVYCFFQPPPKSLLRRPVLRLGLNRGGAFWGGGSSAASAAVIERVTAFSAVRADLGAIDEAQAAVGVLEDDPVEDVLVVVVDDLVDGADLAPVRAEHGRPALDRVVVDRVAVVSHAAKDIEDG